MSSEPDSSAPGAQHGSADGAVRLDRTGMEPSVEVATAVAALERRPVDELDSLYHVVDPELVDHVAAPDGAAVDADVRLSFEYHGYAVTVRGSGVVTVEPPVGDEVLVHQVRSHVDVGGPADAGSDVDVDAPLAVDVPDDT